MTCLLGFLSQQVPYNLRSSLNLTNPSIPTTKRVTSSKLRNFSVSKISNRTHSAINHQSSPMLKCWVLQFSVFLDRMYVIATKHDKFSQFLSRSKRLRSRFNSLLSVAGWNMARRIRPIISDLLAYGTDLITIYCPEMNVVAMVAEAEADSVKSFSASRIHYLILYGSDRWRNNYGYLQCTSCMCDSTSSRASESYCLYC